MSRILITGGAGFIGTNLCEKLLSQNHHVIAIDNLITSTKSNIEPLFSNPKFEFIEQDVTLPLRNWKLEIRNWKFDFIYHLACPTGVPNLTKLAEEMLLACSAGTRNVLELAKKTKAKLLFTSSSEVYGDPQVFPQTENYTGNVDPIGIRSPYEEGKRFSESLIQMYVRKYNVNAKIVRVFNTYGNYMSSGDSRVIPRFLNQALNGKSLTVEGKGLQTRTFCYIDDLVDGLITVMEKGKKGEVYNLGNDKEVRIIDLAKLIIKITNSRSKLKLVERPAHDHKRRLPALEKVKKLGWKPKIFQEIGLRKTLQSIPYS
ncbi:MAG: hypothetical protein A3D74_00575 [Candidatus Levybacteria bacterium RIFCSPHIGHO2_02_FULL_37_13]|nr:MAG: hypothetical protein A3D74_00575 [Candidatus Levybacteria bacterium RIFCSPHIGHO2_02_FULL_37_13]OGH29995.1 MAG: hypothetical protein A3E40_00945 [Candidatus Levybacteria bacterium RIFCSPHIGHO2_12_FULL_37_9]OGH37858.1 MAG: hypothetical protein A3B41_01800 [Candidatus Levybacteria bacterium RIFCSPLOWO2_01_FULL_37_26]